MRLEIPLGLVTLASVEGDGLGCLCDGEFVQHLGLTSIASCLM